MYATYRTHGNIWVDRIQTKTGTSQFSSLMTWFGIESRKTSSLA